MVKPLLFVAPTLEISPGWYRDPMDSVARHPEAERVSVIALGPSVSWPSFVVRALALKKHVAPFGVELEPLTLLNESETSEFDAGSAPQKLRIARAARQGVLARLSTLGLGVSSVLIQRQADLFPSLNVERRATDGRRLVFDIDDAVWRDAHGANGSIFAILKGSNRKLKWLARRADHVIAGNEFLADYIRRFTHRVTVVPSLVDPEEYALRAHAERDEVIIGWIGSRTTAPYVERIVPLLEQVANHVRPRPVRLVMIGGSTRPPRNVAYESHPWTSENQRLALQRMDVGIMPQPDATWVRGKCGYKAVQYMAAGIPVVADDIGVAAAVLKNAGCVVAHSREWVEAIVELAADPPERTRLGREGRSRVEREFSVRRWAPKLAALLSGVAHDY
jgi:glycosyltransferase involved in cell wall biosynthesis